MALKQKKTGIDSKIEKMKSFYFLAYQNINIIIIQSQVDQMRLLNISISYRVDWIHYSVN